MPKERNKADGYREKAYEADTKAMNRMLAPMAYAASPPNPQSPIPMRYSLSYKLFYKLIYKLYLFI